MSLNTWYWEREQVAQRWFADKSSSGKIGLDLFQVGDVGEYHELLTDPYVYLCMYIQILTQCFFFVCVCVCGCYMCVCVCVCVFVCFVFVCVCLCVFVCVCLCLYVCVCVCVCVCVTVSVYM